MLRGGTLLVLIGLAAAACGAGGDAACERLDEFPEQAAEATLAEVEELAATALDSDTPPIRAVGEQLTSMLASRRALENLSPGASVDVLQSELEKLESACSNSG